MSKFTTAVWEAKELYSHVLFIKEELLLLKVLWLGSLLE